MTQGGGHTQPGMDTSEDLTNDCEIPVPQASEDNKNEERDCTSINNPTQYTTNALEFCEGQHNIVV